MAAEGFIVRRAKHVNIWPREADQCHWLAKRLLVYYAYGRSIPALRRVLKVVGEAHRLLSCQHNWTRCANGGLWCIMQLSYGVFFVDGIHDALFGPTSALTSAASLGFEVQTAPPRGVECRARVKCYRVYRIIVPIVHRTATKTSVTPSEGFLSSNSVNCSSEPDFAARLWSVLLRFRRTNEINVHTTPNAAGHFQRNREYPSQMNNTTPTQARNPSSVAMRMVRAMTLNG